VIVDMLLPSDTVIVAAPAIGRLIEPTKTVVIRTAQSLGILVAAVRRAFGRIGRLITGEVRLPQGLLNHLQSAANGRLFTYFFCSVESTLGAGKPNLK
jgi:hypothetical protein